ncbi:hypothetical protein DIPPA_14289 [Diplonema papillatum]|nr:hypothetical protein DIPPA_14289 [Diplonema papillatum]
MAARALPIALLVAVSHAATVTTSPTTTTFNTTIRVDVSPTSSLGTTDTFVVSDSGGTCGNPTATDSVEISRSVTSSAVEIVIRFPTPGSYIVCYTETGQAVAQATVSVTGPTGVTPVTTAVTSVAGSLVLTVTGISLDTSNPINDAAKIVLGRDSDCQTSTAVDMCCVGAPFTLVSSSATEAIYTPAPLPFGGLFTICYRAFQTGVGTSYHRIGSLDATGAAGYAPTTVPAGTFKLTVEGNGLQSGSTGDRLMIATGTVCDDANMVAVSDDLDSVSGQITFTGTVLTPSTGYLVCYRVASLSATATATTYYLMAQPLTVSGALSFSPTTAASAGFVNVTFTGVDLDSTAVGDSAKLIKGTDCLNGIAVVIAGVPGGLSFHPAGLAGASALSLAFNVSGGGVYTMCYKSSLASEYTALRPNFEVAGAAGFYPRVVPQGFMGDLTISGALLNAGDAVSIVPKGTDCSSVSATDLVWASSSTTQGIATITSAATLATSGSFSVCFTPSGGNEYKLTGDLVVSGAQSVSPSELIAGVTTAVSVQGTNIALGDLMKLVIQATEDCTAAFPTYGTVTPSSTQAGQFSVNVPYGGVFTLCYDLGGGGAFKAAATVTVRGVRRLSPFSPVIAAVGASTTFELEGTGLTNLDFLSIVENNASGCATTQVAAAPSLSVVSSTLVRSEGVVFAAGGTFLLCYTATGGPALGLTPMLQVKGPLSFAPTSLNFGESTVVTFAGLALSTSDTIRLVDDGASCDSAASDQSIVSTGSIVVNLKRGGTFYVCYKPFEGGFVVMPTSLTVKGPSSATPTSWFANTAVTVSITGTDLTDGSDMVKLVPTTVGCAGTAVGGTEQPLTSGAVAFTVDVGAYLLCYQLNGASYVDFAPVTVSGISSFAPTTIGVSYSAKITLTGVGLDPLQDRVAISETDVCPTSGPDTSLPSGVTGSASTLVYSTSILTGSSGRAVCLWKGGAWIQLQPLLVVNGPSSRTLVNAKALITGSKLQFFVDGTGLTGGYDRVRWVKMPFATGGQTTCLFPAVSDATILVGSPVQTPVVQLPGGSYLMCYALGPSGTFVPVGAPIGSSASVTGQVDIEGPSGYWISSTGNPRIGQLLTLGFDNLNAGATAFMSLCENKTPATSLAVDPVTNISFSATSLPRLYPLQGGLVNVCFLMPGGDYYALPEVTPNAAFDPTTAISSAGTVAISGPATISAPSTILDAATEYSISLTGYNLSADGSAVRWVPTSDGCLDSTWLDARNYLAVAILTSPGTLLTTFYVGGLFSLCYVYPDDTPQVSLLTLDAVVVRGMFSETTWEAEAGKAGTTLEVPTNATLAPTTIWLWPQNDATDYPGVMPCPDQNSVPGVVTTSLIGQAGSLAIYSAANFQSGYHLLCMSQGAASEYFTLPHFVAVRGPATFAPSSVIAGGVFTISFVGVQITNNDRVRIVPAGQPCNAAASVSVEQPVISSQVSTPQIDTPSIFDVCYQVNVPGAAAGAWNVLRTQLQATGEPVGLWLMTALPSSVYSMTQFYIKAAVVDARGWVVPVSGGTMNLATQNSPGVATPYEGGLTKTVVDGSANFTLALGTVGDHFLLFTYTSGATTFQNLSDVISVLLGNASTILVTLPSTQIESGSAFTLAYQIVDEGYNEVALQNVEVAATLTPVSASAAGGSLSGVATGTTDAGGSGVMVGLSVANAGTYSISVEGVLPASGERFVSKGYEVIITTGNGTLLIFSTQPPNGTTITAGTTFQIAAYVQDISGNTLYAGSPTTFAIRIATTPSPPVGGQLYNTPPASCTQVRCDPVSAGVQTDQGVGSFTGLWLDKPGTYALRVTTPSISAVSNDINVVLGAPHHFRVQENAANLVTEQVFPVSVSLEDLAGNVLTAYSNYTVRATSSSGSLGGTTVRNLNAGVAVFDDLVFGNSGSHTIAFVADGLGISASSDVVDVQVQSKQPTGDTESDDGGIGGIIWIIVVSGIFLVLLIAVIVWFCMKQRNKGSQRSRGDTGKEPEETQPRWEDRYDKPPFELTDNPLDQQPFSTVRTIQTPLDPDMGSKRFLSSSPGHVQTPIQASPINQHLSFAELYAEDVGRISPIPGYGSVPVQASVPAVNSSPVVLQNGNPPRFANY